MLRDYTNKENPGCYHSMVYYLAGLEEVDPYITDIMPTLRSLYEKPDATKAKHRGLKYKSYDIKVVFTDGTTTPFIIEHGQRFDTKKGETRTVKHFECTRLRSAFSDFKIKPVKVGNYQDSLGGGWYSKVPLYEVNGRYFAMMECTC